MLPIEPTSSSLRPHFEADIPIPLPFRRAVVTECFSPHGPLIEYATEGSHLVLHPEVPPRSPFRTCLTFFSVAPAASIWKRLSNPFLPTFQYSVILRTLRCRIAKAAVSDSLEVPQPPENH